MAQTLYDSEVVKLQFDAKEHLIEMEWKQNATSEEYRKMFEEMVSFSEKNRIRRVITDIRKQGLVRLEDVQWLNKEVLERAVEHKLEKIALIIDDKIFSTVYTDVIKNKLKRSPIKVQVFSSPSEARVWLVNE